MFFTKSRKFSVEIDDKEVPMMAGPRTQLVYRKYFKKDLKKTINKCIVSYENNYKNNVEVAEVIWSFAKAANPCLPEFNKWIDSCESIPVRTIVMEMAEKLAK